MRRYRPSPPRGFTLIELMVAVAVVAILAAVAVPAYSQYMLRARIPVGLDALSAFQARMEQRFQDTSNYGTSGCGVSVPTPPNFTVSCTLTDAGAGFTATAVGSGPVAGVSYSIDDDGVRRTLAHPHGVPAQACWSIRGAQCDS